MSWLRMTDDSSETEIRSVYTKFLHIEYSSIHLCHMNRRFRDTSYWCLILSRSNPLTACCLGSPSRMRKAWARLMSYPTPLMCRSRWPSPPPLPRSCASCWGRRCPAPAPRCHSHYSPRPLPLSRTRPGCSWLAWGSDWASVWWSQDRRWVELHRHSQVIIQGLS